MDRSLALLLVLALVVPAATGAQVQAQTQSPPPSLYVSDVSVSPATPAPGEPFTTTVTVQNAQSSPTQVMVTDVAVQDGDGDREYARVEDLGTIPPGGQITVPVTLSFDDPGTRQLRFSVYGRSEQFAGEEGRVRVNAPFVANVRRGGPQLGVEAGDAVVGAETPVTVTVANGEDAPVRNLRVSLSGRNATVEDPERVAATLAAGAERAFNFTATPSARDAAVTATLRYVTAEGNDRSVTRTLDLPADSLRDDVRVDAAVASDGGSPPVAVDVSNFGNAPLTDVTVSASTNGTVHARRSLGDVPADGNDTVRLNLSGVPPDARTLDVTVEYEAGGTRRSASTRVAYSPNPARIELTGISVEPEGNHLLVSGSASNVGLSDASSAVVSVVSADGVTPVSPNREYFVGTVPASDFVSFDLTAQVDDGVDRIPVRVSYIADGTQRTSVVEVPVGDLPPPESGGGDDGGPSLLLVAGGLIALVVVVGVGAYAFVRR